MARIVADTNVFYYNLGAGNTALELADTKEHWLRITRQSVSGVGPTRGCGRVSRRSSLKTTGER
ncbi:hypothetical protein KIH39_20770 [Telmatocola sphagniphila]|uniref:PIN domain-containing protein n=1 Tax=Telmatocola sphagniphila TaxID=1123043 RepID=A0A8E6EUD7_9BACT|nr:hypothetical protein [Telmatocola sphagniphila]QVL31255.1 hypothetical protein KIH39_20770 [Telmatocola sphagniphila]